MKVQRIGNMILPGIESVEVEGMGSFNFRDGLADMHEETARELQKKGIVAILDLEQALATPQLVTAPGPIPQAKE